jgi:membrane fusion protein (multidrug efflux system)
MKSDDAKRPPDPSSPDASASPATPASPPAVSPAAPAAPAADAAAPAGNPRRKKALLGVAGAVLVAGLAYGAYWALVLAHYESTDNAYVQGNVVQLKMVLACCLVCLY